MDVTCPACAARYTADEQKLRGKTARMRCKACDTVWLVSGPEGAATNEAVPAKRAAVLKRGAERENRDLFATSSRAADFGSVKETMRPPAPDATGVAARNETSVLFTVDALKGAARVKTPEPEVAPMSSQYSSQYASQPMSSAFRADDDEGVIDLLALSSGQAKPSMRPVPQLFASEPPPGAFAADVNDTGAQRAQGKLGKRAFIGMGAAAVALVLCTIGLMAVFKGEEPVARSAAAITPPAATAAAPAPPVVTPPAPPPASETASANASSDDDAKATKKGKGKGKGAKASGAKLQSGGASASKSSSSKSSSEAKPVVKPAADKCGCKGDFNCILRCTAKGS
jgi:predicted Zn finger-like uncharacterized protein